MSQVRNVKQARNGNILIAATWSGAFRYDGKSFTNITGSQIGWYRFWDILEDRRGNIWFACLGGAGDFLAISEADDGSIWFGAAGGVWRYDGKTITDFRNAAGQQQ